jgi:hypothetical protein
VFGCREPVDVSLPTRLVDCSDSKHPKLIESNSGKGIYLALSYVWGQAQPHQTTSENISRYYHGIEWSTLPQTIKDAITTTHALGFRYLWTDALCIIQDSMEDKAREISEMDKIFDEAYMTIMAESATRVSEGFLQDRRTLSNLPVHIRCPDNEIGTVYLAPCDDSYLSVMRSRAWCFQEWLLSRCSLVFSAMGLEYHCYRHSIYVRDEVAPPQVRHRRNRLPRELLGLPNAFLLDLEKASKSWHNTVLDYTELSMTNPADKLLAIAGVAKRFGRQGKLTRYLAGLWEETLVHDLMWRDPPESQFLPRPGILEEEYFRSLVGHASKRSQPPRPALYRSPSWSWAAVDKVVGWEESSSKVPFCDILRCDVVLQNGDRPFGAVTGGTLILRTVLIKAVLRSVHVLDGSGELALLSSLASTEMRNDIINLPQDQEWPLPWDEDDALFLAPGRYHFDCSDESVTREVYAAVLQGVPAKILTKPSTIGVEDALLRDLLVLPPPPVYRPAGTTSTKPPSALLQHLPVFPQPLPRGPAETTIANLSHANRAFLGAPPVFPSLPVPQPAVMPKTRPRHIDRVTVEGLLLYPSVLPDGHVQYRRVGWFDARIPLRWFQDAPRHEIEIV